jgi:hypothetical protein
LPELAEAGDFELALPAQEIGAIFIAAFSGLADRELILRRAGERLGSPAMGLLDLLAATVAAPCRGQRAAGLCITPKPHRLSRHWRAIGQNTGFTNSARMVSPLRP